MSTYGSVTSSLADNSSFRLKQELHRCVRFIEAGATAQSNYIFREEYPALGEIESRCVNIVAKLFNAPLTEHENALGVSTVGSSEAIILGVLAAKRRWQNARRAAGKSIDKPNLVMNAAVQVCWEKVSRAK